jgi:hypothetical protein
MLLPENRLKFRQAPEDLVIFLPVTLSIHFWPAGWNSVHHFPLRR